MPSSGLDISKEVKNVSCLFLDLSAVKQDAMDKLYDCSLYLFFQSKEMLERNCTKKLSIPFICESFIPSLPTFPSWSYVWNRSVTIRIPNAMLLMPSLISFKLILGRQSKTYRVKRWCSNLIPSCRWSRISRTGNDMLWRDWFLGCGELLKSLTMLPFYIHFLWRWKIVPLRLGILLQTYRNMFSKWGMDWRGSQPGGCSFLYGDFVHRVCAQI